MVVGDFAYPFVTAAMADAHGGAHTVALAVVREDQHFLVHVPEAVVGHRGMAGVVIHEPDERGIDAEAGQFLKDHALVTLGCVVLPEAAQPGIPGQSRACAAQRVARLRMHPRIVLKNLPAVFDHVTGPGAADRHPVDLVQAGRAAQLEHLVDGQRRNAAGVFNPVEAFLLHGGDDPAVVQQGRRGVMSDVQTENFHGCPWRCVCGENISEPEVRQAIAGTGWGDMAG